ncbi:MAG: helix-turn-helix domain-containing protein [Acidaminococcaceae bacterium]
MEHEFKLAREQAGLTQKGMSELMEIPLRTIQDWERGLRTPPSYVKRFVLNELATIAKTHSGL